MADNNVIPLSNIFVLGDNTSGSGVCKSILGFRSVLPTSTVTGDNEDAQYPFINSLDYRDNTQYSPSIESGSVTIEFRQAANVELDYLGIAIHNGKTAGLTGFLELLINGVWTVVANFTPLGDLKTICEKFDLQSSQRQRLTLNFTSKLYIGTIYLGKSWQFSRMPNEGFTPANSNNIDEVVGFQSNTGQFIISRRKQVGYAQSGAFDFIAFDEINVEYIDYMNHVKDGKPFFMKWDVNVNQNIFGQHASPNNLRAPSYTSANTATFDFEMVGYN
tara:strand:- start:3193 stop:4017 length:825 start_codon:yes stop_codon:yes gene_type:complete